MAVTQADKAQRFRDLHKASAHFVIANAWDAGSARILEGLGFAALATSSGAQAGVLGRRDGAVSRDEALAHCRAIVEATDLPVSADLEKGFGDTPEAAAEAITLAARVGLVGGSIEDASGHRDKPLFELGLATERIAAAVAAAPSSRIASSSPLFTVVPLCTFSSRTTPLTGAGTSSMTLSVSRSARFSSRFTFWPGCLCQTTKVASATDSGSCGTRISTLMSFSFWESERVRDCPHH